MFPRSRVALAQVEVGNTTENLVKLVKSYFL